MKPRLVFTAAVMDCFHEGHLNLLGEMRKLASVGQDTGQLVVMLHNDRATWLNKKRFPIQSLEQRIANLKATHLVDQVWITEEQDPAAEFEQLVKTSEYAFDIHFMRGDDWAEFPGKAKLEQLGIPIHIIKYTEGISTTKRREQLAAAEFDEDEEVFTRREQASARWERQQKIDFERRLLERKMLEPFGVTEREWYVIQGAIDDAEGLFRCAYPAETEPFYLEAIGLVANTDPAETIGLTFKLTPLCRELLAKSGIRIIRRRCKHCKGFEPVAGFIPCKTPAEFHEWSEAELIQVCQHLGVFRGEKCNQCGEMVGM